MKHLLSFILGIISVACLASITSGPNNTGTNVITANVVAQSPLIGPVNGAGNPITNVSNFGGGTTTTNMATVNGVKVYRALVTQVGTNDPTAVTLENGLGGSATLLRLSEGVYQISINGAFTSGKTFALMAPGLDGSGAVTPCSAMVGEGDEDTFSFKTGVDGTLSYTAFEILVYP